MSTEDSVPRLTDFTEREKMIGEYRVMGLYPRGHLMEFVRPGLGPNVLPTVDVEKLGDDEWVTVAGWPVARQHPRGRHGTVFVTIEDETGDVQVIVWSDLFARRRRELGSQVIEVTGRVSRWDGTTNVIATDLCASGRASPCPRPTTGTDTGAVGQIFRVEGRPLMAVQRADTWVRPYRPGLGKGHHSFRRRPDSCPRNRPPSSGARASLGDGGPAGGHMGPPLPTGVKSEQLRAHDTRRAVRWPVL